MNIDKLRDNMEYKQWIYNKLFDAWANYPTEGAWVEVQKAKQSYQDACKRYDKVREGLI